MREFESERAARFQAWLSGGIYAQKPVGRGYVVWSTSEAKDQIKTLVSEGKFDEAHSLAAGLNRRADSPSAQAATFSSRVKFATYASLIIRAEQERMSVTELLKRWILADLKKGLASLDRTRLNEKRIQDVHIAIGAWERQRVKDRGISSYSLQFSGFPSVEFELIRSATQKTSEKIRESARLTKAEEESDAFLKDTIFGGKFYTETLMRNWLNLVDFAIEKLDSEFFLKFTAKFPLFSTLEKQPLISSQLMQKLGLEFAGGRFLKVGNALLPLDSIPCKTIDFFGASLQLLPTGQISIAGLSLPIEEPDKWRDFKDGLLGNTQRHLARMEKQLEETLTKDDMAGVERITRELGELQREFRLREFGTEVLRFLVRGKSQVVSISAPEIVVSAWEALTKGDLDKLVESGREKGE